MFPVRRRAIAVVVSLTGLLVTLIAVGGPGSAGADGPGVASPSAPRKAASAARPAPREEKAIRAAVLAYLESLRLMRGVTVEVEVVSGIYARTRAVPPPATTDPAWVFVKRVKGKWGVIAGPGTRFEDAELEGAGVPRALWVKPIA